VQFINMQSTSQLLKVLHYMTLHVLLLLLMLYNMVNNVCCWLKCSAQLLLLPHRLWP
jgi:hypothetical protein